LPFELNFNSLRDSRCLLSLQGSLDLSLQEAKARLMFGGKQFMPCLTGDGKAMQNYNFQERKGRCFDLSRTFTHPISLDINLAHKLAVPMPQLQSISFLPKSLVACSGK
jgi:hypothetical protein